LNSPPSHYPSSSTTSDRRREQLARHSCGKLQLKPQKCVRYRGAATNWQLVPPIYRQPAGLIAPPTSPHGGEETQRRGGATRVNKTESCETQANNTTTRGSKVRCAGTAARPSPLLWSMQYAVCSMEYHARWCPGARRNPRARHGPRPLPSPIGDPSAIGTGLLTRFLITPTKPGC
jgi:hypothetical protein